MTGLIILAAGSSSRLGKPKQHLIYNGQNLLQHAIDISRASKCSAIVVVLGANEALIRNEITATDVEIILNPDWEEGLSSSIKCGIKSITQTHPNLSQLIIMLCDQPFVDTELLNKLIELRETSQKPIVASTYDNTLGTPALFHRSIFPQLLALEGPQGAKKIILDYKDDVAAVPFALGNIDIDTEEDYRKLLNEYT